MYQKPIVRVVPYQPHCFAFGGFELQMIGALQATKSEGYDAEKLDFWSQNDDFNILHVWGYSLAHLPTVYWAHKSGKKIIMSALLQYPTIRYQISHHISSKYGIGKKYQELLGLLDVVSVVNDLQAETATRIFRIPDNKVAVIPNIVDDSYFSSPKKFPSPVEIDDYILCVGNVCIRKNQLALASACAVTNKSLLIVGDVMIGEEKYGTLLSNYIKDRPRIKWIRKMQPGSDSLIAAYQNCIAFALPSLNETQPISLLEASVLQKPLLIADRPYAKQKYYANALCVDPESVADLRYGVEEITENGRRYITSSEIINDCGSKKVGMAYGRLFESMTNIN